ncbi:MAG: hypothetical protein JJU00_02355 [Opitutales bacterium]|nr:hypothetical protein [Opitutales bacterium]
MSSPSFRLFERFGVELEYMIVDAATLDVRPVADRIIQTVGAARKNEIRHGKTRWSNELVLHVIELKTDGPAPALEGLAAGFQEEVRFLNATLAKSGCRLLPSAMHPWMDPARETHLWPHGDRAIYEAFDRIFGCAGHGWSNVQSTHINLPFSGDDEFNRLHTAIRLVLPLLPALAASSPFQEGVRAPKLDMRLEHYRNNCARIPSITGHIIPERVRSRAEYEAEILARIERDLTPHNPGGILESEWVNARGAIARFERGAIEIRLLDIQEHPGADLAILQFVVAVLRALVAERHSSLRDQRAPVVGDLGEILSGTIAKAEDALVKNPIYLDALGLPADRPGTAGDALWALLKKTAPPGAPWRADIEFILRRGCLARRLRRAAGPNPDKDRLHTVYTELADCLQRGAYFDH